MKVLKAGTMIMLVLSLTVQAASQSSGAVAPDSGDLDVTDLRMFVEVMDQVRSAYVEPVPDHQLWVYAVRGLLESLDPHSEFLDAQEYQDLKDDTSGSFDGVGLELGRDHGELKVIAPIDDSPAAKAGIRAGDVIVRLNGQLVHGQNYQRILDQMRGNPGTHLKLTIMRSGNSKPLEFDLVRQIIAVSTVHGRWLESGFALIRISMFAETTGKDVENVIHQLQHEGTVRGLVLDLRNNPGGVLTSAIDVADDFLDHGVIVSTRGRLPESNHQFLATPGQLLPGVPMVVLINSGTASAAEIVSGALQDHHRALILGTTSFGKGSVQSVLSLNDGQGIKLTTARYFTPSGRSIQAQGITPDLTVLPADVTVHASNSLYKEANLAGHLENPQTGTGSDEVQSANNKEKELVSSDFQLYQALAVVKAANLLQASSASPVLRTVQ